MVLAIANVSGVSPAQPDSFSLYMQTSYIESPEEGGNGQGAEVIVTVPANADPDAIRTILSDAIVADAEGKGYTLDRGNLTLPAFQKG